MGDRPLHHDAPDGEPVEPAASSGAPPTVPPWGSAPPMAPAGPPTAPAGPPASPPAPVPGFGGLRTGGAVPPGFAAVPTQPPPAPAGATPTPGPWVPTAAQPAGIGGLAPATSTPGGRAPTYRYARNARSPLSLGIAAVAAVVGCTILGALLQLLVGADGGDGIVTVIAVLTSPILVVIPFVMVIWWVTRIGTNDGSFGLGWVTVGYLTFGSVAQVGQFQFDVLTSMRPLLIFLILVSGGLSLGLRRILFARIWRAGDLPMVGLSTLAWLPEFVGTQVILWSLLLNLDDDGYQLPTVSSSTLLIGRSLIVFSYLATVVILLVVTVNQHRVITAEQEQRRTLGRRRPAAF